MFILLIYNLALRRIMDYYMAHVLEFLHLTSNVPNMILMGIMVLFGLLKLVNEAVLNDCTIIN